MPIISHPTSETVLLSKAVFKQEKSEIEVPLNSLDMQIKELEICKSVWQDHTLYTQKETQVNQGDIVNNNKIHKRGP